MELNVKSCLDCPFRYSDYDDWAIGDDIEDNCTLAQYLNFNEYTITSRNLGDKFKMVGRPEWCPLNKEDIKITKSTN